MANPANITANERKAAEEEANELVKAALLISGVEKRRYGKLKDELANNYLLGTDQYPDMFDKALRILGNYQTTRPNMPFRGNGSKAGLAFIQRGGRRGQGCGGCAGTSGRGETPTSGGADASGGGGDVSTMTGGSGGERAKKTNNCGDSHCYNCGSTDHWAYECLQLTNKQQAWLHMNLECSEDVEEQEHQEGHQLLNWTMVQGGALPDNRAYLDGCSMVTAFKMDKYLREIKTVPGGIKINCNAGVVSTNQMGTYRNLKVWYIPDGITNIFLMHKLKKKYCITYDSWEGHYIVHTPKGEVNFHKDKQGLPYIELDGPTGCKAAMMLLQSMQQEHHVCTEVEVLHVQTVHGNYERHTKRDMLQAKEARRAQAMIGNPSKGDFKGMVSGNLIKNCLVTMTDITNARKIFCPDLAGIRGKTVQQTPAPVVADYVAVTCLLVEQNGIVTMAADVFFVDSTSFLVTLSRRIKFITVEHVPVRTAISLSKHITRILQVYERAGFRVRTILMDGEFEKVQDSIPHVECNATVAKEHVSKAERTIRTIKKQMRGLLATLPFQHIPRCMKIKFDYFMVLWLNAFPVKDGILAAYSPGNCSCGGKWTTVNIAEFFRGRTVRFMTNRPPQTQ